MIKRRCAIYFRCILVFIRSVKNPTPKLSIYFISFFSPTSKSLIHYEILFSLLWTQMVCLHLPRFFRQWNSLFQILLPDWVVYPEYTNKFLLLLSLLFQEKNCCSSFTSEWRWEIKLSAFPFIIKWRYAIYFGGIFGFICSIKYPIPSAPFIRSISLFFSLN